MRKNKRQKNKKKKAAPKKKLVRRIKKKSKLKRLAKPKARPLTKKKIDDLLKVERLIVRGQERGFVTYDEILKEFPHIETNIMFLDELYKKLHALSIED